MTLPALPPLLKLPGESEYRGHYRASFCNQSHFTHDHIRVQFFPETFNHAFYESSNRRAGSKDVFSLVRAERMPWILYALADPTTQLLAGWLNEEKRYTHDRRVTLLSGNYVVILRLGKAPNTASFTTAYLLDPPSRGKILASPVWDRARCHWGI